MIRTAGSTIVNPVGTAMNGSMPLICLSYESREVASTSSLDVAEHGDRDLNSFDCRPTTAFYEFPRVR